MHDIFEKIIRREIPAHIVYEDETVLCFLDINPIRKGHTLVIPKEKFENIFDGSPEMMAHMIVVAQKVARALLTSVNAHGVNIHMNNGDAAGQDIFHAHIHVIPRFARNEAHVAVEHETYNAGEAALLATHIKNTLG